MKNEINIMLVDDHKMIRDGIKLMLKKNHEIVVVHEASNGFEAVAYIDENPTKIDVILMDISMPKLDGVAATREIKENHPDLHVLALTMHINETYIFDMMKAGASGYILKDTGRNELVEAIKKVADGNLYYSPEVSTTVIKSLMSGKKEKKHVKEVLSEREKEVIKWVVKGLTNAEIGEKIYLSTRTIESHRRNIVTKLDLKNTAELISYAIKQGWA